MTETLLTAPAEEEPQQEAADSGTESDGDADSIPELEETTGETTGDAGNAPETVDDSVNKAKQSRGEKKARKIYLQDRENLWKTIKPKTSQQILLMKKYTSLKKETAGII